MQIRAFFTVRPHWFRHLVFPLLCCAALWAQALPAHAEKQVPATPLQSAMPMLPHLEWLLDSGGKLTVEDMGLPQQQAAFRPLNLANLPTEAGTVWLRFTLAGRPSEVRPATLLLDMGEGVPATPTLFVPKHNVLTGGTEWQSFSPSQRSVFLMPETRNEPVTAYIRMDGLPGMWFAPMLRTPHNAATALERLARPAVIVALSVIMLLCLLRGLTERGEWRIWTSVYTGAALFHAVWGVPATTNGHVDMLNMAAVLAPGVALMILPHVGRHLLRTRQTSRAIDIQLFLLSLPGAALALLPLLPGFSWTTRFLDLWPVGTLLLVPTTVGAWLCGLPGARRFLLGCLLPPLGVAAGVLGMGTSLPAPLLATAPLWGLALGALIIAGTAAPQEHRALAADAPAPAAPSPQMLVDDDPNLRIVSPEELAQAGASQPTLPGDSHALALEERLRGPLDALLRDGAALEQCSLPPAARQLAESMVQSAHRMASALAGGPADSTSLSPREPVIFDLQEVLRQAHDSVSALADSKNIALSWFMPPHLGQRYRGGAAQLGEVLGLLLESSVRATSRGAVQVAVRRMPESVNPGHLLFSVTDTGTGMPPQERSSLALARAWELAGANRGFLGVESSPHGATISFTLHLEPLTAEAGQEEQAAQGPENAAYPTIIVAADSSGERQLLGFFLEGMGAAVIEARTVDEAVDLYMDRPANLMIFDGDLPAAALHTAVERVRTYEKAQNVPAALIMGLSSDDGQWEDMRMAGFTHALPKPITRGGLRSTVCQLLPQCMPQDAPAPEADLSRSLPLLDGPLAEAPLPELRAEVIADADADEEIIDTGMPLLNMDAAAPLTMPLTMPPTTKDAPASEQLLPQLDADGMGLPSTADAPLLPDMPIGSGQAATAEQPVPSVRAGLAEPSGEAHGQRKLSVPNLPDMPDLLDMGRTHAAEATSGAGLDTSTEPLSMEPAAAAPPNKPGAAPGESAMPDLFADTQPVEPVAADVPPLPDSTVAVPEMPVEADAAPADAPADALVDFFVGTPDRLAVEKSHEDYLTSLLDGDDSLLKTEPDVDAPAEPDVRADGAPVHVTAQEEVEQREENAQKVETAQASAPVAVSALEPEPESGSEAGSGVDPKAEETDSSTPVNKEPPVTISGTVKLSLTKKPRKAVADKPVPSEPVVSVQAAPAPATSDAYAVAEAESASLIGTTVQSVPAAAQDSAEWVGEPQPLGTPAAPSSAAPAPADSGHRVPAWGTPASTAAADSLEWVGEPQPVGAARPAPVEAGGTRSFPSPAPQSLDNGLLHRPVLVGAAYRAGGGESAEWVGEPQPIQRPASPAPLASAPTPSPAEEAAAAPEAPRASERFVPLSMHADQPPVASGEVSPQAAAGREDSTRADKARPSLLPQSTPLMDFIIAGPAEPQPEAGPAPSSSTPVLSAPVEPAPAQPAQTAGPSTQTETREASFAPTSVATPRRESATAPRSGYGSVGEPMPVTPKQDTGTKSQEVPLAHMLDYFDQSVRHARLSFEKRDAGGVHEGAAFIAKQADKLGLRTLARMARCVADAGKAGDLDAVKDLLPELESTVERNRIALGG